jgi:hypothetical protein
LGGAASIRLSVASARAAVSESESDWVIFGSVGMMDEHTFKGATFKHLDTPQARKLGEMYLHYADLEASYAALNLYFEKYAETEAESEEALIGSSLFRDGIVLYCACFSVKDDNKLVPEAVYGHLSEWKKYYSAIHDTRDAFVGHNFGPQRQYDVTAVLTGSRESLKVAAIGHTFVRFEGWRAEEKKVVLSFIDIAREHLKTEILALESIIMVETQKLSTDQLAALPDASYSIPRSEDFRLSRSRYRDKAAGRQQPFPKDRLVRRFGPE